MRVKLIVNPIAGRGRGAKLKDTLIAALREANAEFDAAVTGQHGAGRIIAKQAAAEGYDVIVAAGGDGTVNEVVNGLAGSKAALGVLPLGTGNDFAMMMGMPNDPLAALGRILYGRRLPVDLCRINDRFFASSVGAGFDGEVAHAANHSFRHLRGMIVYILAVFSTVFSYRPRHVRISIDGESFERDITLMAVANSRSYGGGMRVTPNALADDGFLEVCIAERMNPFRILYMLPKFISGKHLSAPEITSYRAREIVIESAQPLYYQVDGEVLRDTRLSFRIIPHGLLVAGAEFTPCSAGIKSTATGES